MLVSLIFLIFKGLIYVVDLKKENIKDDNYLFDFVLFYSILYRIRIIVLEEIVRIIVV